MLSAGVSVPRAQQGAENKAAPRFPYFDQLAAGFTKIHLDCSMRLADDPEGALDLEVSSGRAARLAKIASGSFTTQGMAIIPCSIKTLSAIANSYANSLITRAADVTLKEGRPLILAVRETPLHKGHLRIMSLAVDAGAIIFPLVPAFYQKPKTIEEIIRSTVKRILMRLDVEIPSRPEWTGSKNNK